MSQGTEMDFVHEPARRTPVVARADVVVVGGGIAGVSAAVSAAKNGARTILIEQQAVVGGTILGGSSVLNSFTNAHLRHPEAGRRQLVRGFGQEIINRMVRAGGCPGFRPGMTLEDPQAPRQVIMLPEAWKSVSFALLRDHDIELMTRTFFADAIVSGGCIQAVTVHNKQGRVAIAGEQFIDASGDGDLAARAGAGVIEEHEQDHIKETSLVFGMNRVDVARLIEWGRELGFWEGREPNGCNEVGLPVYSLSINLQNVPAIGEAAKEMGVRMLHLIAVGDEMFYMNSTRVRPPREAGLLTWRGAVEAERKNREQIEQVVAMCREHIGGFESAYLHHTAGHFGVRRTRTVRCDYDITIDDVREERGFPDEIGRFGYQDLPWPGYEPKNGGSYGIPFRAIVPQGVDNLLVAGRMITSEWTAHMSTRNTGCCIVQGEGAGAAAALCVRHKTRPRELDVAALQDALLAQGVYLERGAAVA